LRSCFLSPYLPFPSVPVCCVQADKRSCPPLSPFSPQGPSLWRRHPPPPPLSLCVYSYMTFGIPPPTGANVQSLVSYNHAGSVLSFFFRPPSNPPREKEILLCFFFFFFSVFHRTRSVFLPNEPQPSSKEIRIVTSASFSPFCDAGAEFSSTTSGCRSQFHFPFFKGGPRLSPFSLCSSG